MWRAYFRRHVSFNKFISMALLCVCAYALYKTTQGQTGAAAAAAVHQESLPIFAHTHISFGEGWKCAAPNINSCAIFIYRPDFFFLCFHLFGENVYQK